MCTSCHRMPLTEPSFWQCSLGAVRAQYAQAATVHRGACSPACVGEGPKYCPRVRCIQHAPRIACFLSPHAWPVINVRCCFFFCRFRACVVLCSRDWGGVRTACAQQPQAMRIPLQVWHLSEFAICAAEIRGFESEIRGSERGFSSAM